MTGLSRLFIDHRPWLSDLEINPLIVLAEGQGVRAVDVRAVRAHAGRSLTHERRHASPRTA